MNGFKFNEFGFGLLGLVTVAGVVAVGDFVKFPS